MRARATAAAALGDLQVALMRQLAVRLKAAGVPATRTLGLEARADQLAAAAREMRRILDTQSDRHGGLPGLPV